MAGRSTLRIRAAAADLETLAPLAREGLGLRLPAGRTLRESLALDLGICPDCVEERLRTVFLDGSPVDDIDAERLRPGCALALAGALPGVAGIAMRRDSPVGVFREGITSRADDSAGEQAGDLDLTLRLFNSAAEECLVTVLAHGATVRGGRLAELLAGDAARLAAAGFELDGRALSRAELIDALATREEPVLLKAVEWTNG